MVRTTIRTIWVGLMVRLLYIKNLLGFEMSETTGLVSATVAASRIGFDQVLIISLLSNLAV